MDSIRREELLQKIEQAADMVQRRICIEPKIAIVCGSGLSQVLPTEDGVTITWDEIPHFPLSTVAGHCGEFWAGEISNHQVLIQRGRVHCYEGFTIDEVVFSVRMLALLGIKTLIITNAAGAINSDFVVGELVLITDHINFLGDNPLKGKNFDRLGPRFPDVSDAYSSRLRTLAKEVALSTKITLKEGVYIAVLGPSYETPAEIRAFRTIGADLVGMSTVPEVIAAAHAGIEVLGISCATNMAAGIDPQARLSHKEVIEVTKRKEKELGRLILGILQRLPVD
ncbi:TPA: purine-nucleoside phosphorylase [Candidatus Acetothermia bacterium]|nr:purine-nucleoside phosphorylase [Candidatus Acetothermia bacterium]